MSPGVTPSTATSSRQVPGDPPSHRPRSSAPAGLGNGGRPRQGQVTASGHGPRRMPSPSPSLSPSPSPSRRQIQASWAAHGRRGPRRRVLPPCSHLPFPPLPLPGSAASSRGAAGLGCGDARAHTLHSAESSPPTSPPSSPKPTHGRPRPCFCPHLGPKRAGTSIPTDQPPFRHWKSEFNALKVQFYIKRGIKPAPPRLAGRLQPPACHRSQEIPARQSHPGGDSPGDRLWFGMGRWHRKQ